MELTQAALMREVERCIPAHIVRDIIQFAEHSQPALWGQNHGRMFVCQWVLLALYKDLYAISYDHLFNMVKAWLKGGNCTLHHNTHILCHHFKAWGKLKTQLGNQVEWAHMAGHHQFTGIIHDTCLWIDSMDLRLEGKSTISCKDPSWSFKKNSPAQHFMVLQDANCKIQAVWGGYTPKLHDGEFLKLQQDWIKEHLTGASSATTTSHGATPSTMSSLWPPRPVQEEMLQPWKESNSSPRRTRRTTSSSTPLVHGLRGCLGGWRRPSQPWRVPLQMGRNSIPVSSGQLLEFTTAMHRWIHGLVFHLLAHSSMSMVVFLSAHQQKKLYGDQPFFVGRMEHWGNWQETVWHCAGWNCAMPC